MAKPQKRRSDPPSRSPDGHRPWAQLIGADPAMHYVYVNPNDDQFGIDYYEALGYEKVIRQEGGVRAAVGKVRGDSGSTITVLGQVLMQLPLEQREILDLEGAGGGGGQRHIDEIEKRIIKPGGVDGLRGMRGYLGVQNETESMRSELVHG